MITTMNFIINTKQISQFIKLHVIYDQVRIESIYTKFLPKYFKEKETLPQDSEM